MELRHLRYFLAVAREMSFSRAADQLHIAQPPLSRQIHQLEEELGAALFDRTARPLKLTPAGQFFQAQAQLVMDRLAEARTATARIARGQRRWFGIGFVPSTLYGALPEVIRRFRAAQPEVEVGLLELTTVQQIDALKAGRIDVGFGRLRFEEDERIAAEVVREEPLVAALPDDHRLARRKRLALEELAPELRRPGARRVPGARAQAGDRVRGQRAADGDRARGGAHGLHARAALGAEPAPRGRRLRPPG